MPMLMPMPMPKRTPMPKCAAREHMHMHTPMPMPKCAARKHMPMPMPRRAQVQPLRGVGVVSFARLGDGCTLVDLADAVAFAYITRSVASHASFLLRCLGALGHECGRLLGMSRCVHGRCLLNGAGQIAELDERPLLCCPCETKKVAMVRAHPPPPPPPPPPPRRPRCPRRRDL